MIICTCELYFWLLTLEPFLWKARHGVELDVSILAHDAYLIWPSGTFTMFIPLYRHTGRELPLKRLYEFVFSSMRITVWLQMLPTIYFFPSSQLVFYWGSIFMSELLLDIEKYHKNIEKLFKFVQSVVYIILQLLQFKYQFKKLIL